MKLYIYHGGDPSVGIFPEQWEIQCPFNKEDLNDENDEDYFKEKMLKVYQEFSEFKLFAVYDYEMKHDVDESGFPGFF